MSNPPVKKLSFTNEVINKKKLQKLMSLTFHNYGIIKSSLIADRLKNLTFHYATKSGISLSIEDLRVPYKKRDLIGITTNEVETTEQTYCSGSITVVERFQKVIDIWNNANNSLKDEVLTYFRESDPLNPLYIMAFSGARGNISQVRQLVGMRGLMADPQGQIIDLPIKSNFREGLKVTEYIISSYGARKGLVDTALRTADSGYLTRRLVDVAQDIIVRDEDCLTQEGLSAYDLLEQYKTGLTLNDRVIGRLLAKPLVVDRNKTIPANTEITSNLLKELTPLNINNLEVRSPLTCKSTHSVCRKCYGWHLSYSKLVDLGEAVGILAAQSIGEPGTQLTMRTFHTGGVFSGDLTKQIRTPFPGTVNYKLNTKTNLVRTIHGEKGFLLLEKITLRIENSNGTLCTLDIPEDAMLLVNNKQRVYPNQIIAEIKKDASLVLEEDRRDIYTEVSGEVFFQGIDVEENIDGEGATKKISKTAGLIWILSGNKYILPNSSKLAVGLGQRISRQSNLLVKKIINKFSGVVSLDSFSNKGEIKVMHTSMIIKNALLKGTTKSDPLLEIKTFDTKKIFKFLPSNKEILKSGQTIAVLEEDSYKTDTGGTIYYGIDYIGTKRRKNIKKMFTGSLYWLSEETHSLNTLGLDDIKVAQGNFIEKGSEILAGVTSNVSGFVEIDEANREIIIKPGELFLIDKIEGVPLSRTNGFVSPGTRLFNYINIQKLSFIEFVTRQDHQYLLIRPVQIFRIPQEKGFGLEHTFFPRTKAKHFNFRTVKKIFYKDGEKVKSSKGVSLLKTFLVLDIQSKYSLLQPRVEYLQIPDRKNESIAKLKIALYENIKVFDIDNQRNKNSTKILVKNNSYVLSNTTLTTIAIAAEFNGTLGAINKNNESELLLLKDTDIKVCLYDAKCEKLFVKKGDLVRVGTYLTSTVRSKYAGQIHNIKNDRLEIRLGRPYLISEGTILRAEPRSIIEKSDILATLVYDKVKTVDIVQGLPKVEEILEARKIKNGCLLAPHDGKVYLRNTSVEIIKPDGNKVIIDVEAQRKVRFVNGENVKFLQQLTDGPISPHDKLETLFHYYNSKFSTIEACKKSFKTLQLFLVSEVQRTYLSQGVQIADKHIEIIVKQMTSKVIVTFGGDTTLLPGEILTLNQAELITGSAKVSEEEPPEYKPILLGLTKASLNSGSFISAASFQETTRVLTEAAIEGKKDWLNGLKENVIIGRLIPAGTGFNFFENLKKAQKETAHNTSIKDNNPQQLMDRVIKTRAQKEI